MPSKRRQMFEDLGLMEELTAQNPLQVLGIDPIFAQDLIREGGSNENLAAVAKGIHRALSKLYHPDTGEYPDADKFNSIHTAFDQIEKANPAQLQRWSKTKRTSSSGDMSALREQANLLTEITAEILDRTMRLGHHALHYSQLTWSQGLLAQRGGIPLLIREEESNSHELQVLRGVILPQDEADDQFQFQPTSKGINFHRFLRNNDSFGIAPGKKIALYMDEEDRASLLEPDLSFIMDVTQPIAKLREEYANRTSSSHEVITNSDWVQPGIATLHSTTIGADAFDTAAIQTTIFPNSKAYTPWHVPLEVIGHITDSEFHKRVRNQRMAGARAIASRALTAASASYFDLTPIPTSQLVTTGVGYSPLLVSSQDLLLYDPKHRMPVLTDAKILGIIGSHSDSTDETA